MIKQTKLIMYITLLFLTILGLTGQPMMDNENRPVSPGEELEFKLSYGWFTIGKAKMKTSDEIITSNGHEAYKVDIEGKTAGLVGTFSRVDDRWGGIVDKETFLPYYSYRDLSEGNYRLDEKVYFDYNQRMIRADYYDPRNGESKPSKYFEFKEEDTFDMIGGLLYARSIDYRSMNSGDTITMNAYFDKEFYTFSMVYHGVEMIKTKVGWINCYKIVPVMPDNKIFRGENSVTFWVSADTNRLPLKVEATMFFGTAYCELTSFKNVKSGIDFN
jgi:hypothetical protein